MSIYASPTPYPSLSALAAATEKQVAFIQKLAAERGAAFASDGTALESLEELRSLLRRHASAIIDELLAVPPRPRPVTETLYPVREGGKDLRPDSGLDLSALHGGRYAATLNGVTKFFKVDVVDSGNWAGWIFVKIQASDDLHRQGSQKPGQAYRGASVDYLTEILRDDRAAMELYGQELGACGHCGRTLTDETSRARGIGPVCAEKMGW